MSTTFATTSPIAANSHQQVQDVVFRLVAIALAVVGAIRIASLLPAACYHIDFSHYYGSAKVALNGHDPYSTPLFDVCVELGLEHHANVPSGTNPPLLMRCIMPLARLPLPAAFGVWLLFEIGCFFVLIESSRRLIGVSWSNPHWLVWFAMLLNCHAVIDHFHYSQVQIPIAASIAVATLCIRKGCGTLAAAIIALVAMLKIYPVVLLPWFLFARAPDRKAIAHRALVMGGVACLAFWVTGISMWTSFASSGIQVIEECVGRLPCNYSFQSIVVAIHNTARNEVLGGVGNRWLLSIGKVISAFVVAAAYLVAYRRRQSMSDVAAVGLISVAMISASIVCWSHYMVLLIPAATYLVFSSQQVDVKQRRRQGNRLARQSQFNPTQSNCGRSAQWLAPLLAVLVLMPESSGVIVPSDGPWADVLTHAQRWVYLYPTAMILLFAVVLARSSAKPWLVKQ